MSRYELHGPVFDVPYTRGRVRKLLLGCTKQVAGQASAEVHRNLDTSIRHPTPYYETQINIRASGYSDTVNDRGVIYGPWLEGTGSRNRTTRFKGYFSFRRATQKVKTMIRQLTAKPTDEFIRSMN